MKRIASLAAALAIAASIPSPSQAEARTYTSVSPSFTLMLGSQTVAADAEVQVQKWNKYGSAQPQAKWNRVFWSAYGRYEGSDNWPQMGSTHTVRSGVRVGYSSMAFYHYTTSWLQVLHIRAFADVSTSGIGAGGVVSVCRLFHIAVDRMDGRTKVMGGVIVPLLF